MIFKINHLIKFICAVVFLTLFTIPLAAKENKGKLKPIWFILYESGIAKYKDGLYQESLHDLEEALYYKDDLPMAHKYAGIIYKSWLNYSKAIYHFEKTLKYRPNQTELYIRLGDLYEARSLLNLAQRYYLKGLKLSANNTILLFRLGIVALKQGNLSEKEAFFTQINLLAGKKPRELNIEAQQLIKKGKFKKAYELMLEAVKMNPAFIESYELLAKFYRDHKRADLAMDTYKKILEFSPVYVPALIKLSHLYYEQNNLLESQKYLEEAIKIQPKQERYWIELVNLLEEMGNYSLRSIIIQKGQKQGIQIPNSR